MAIKQKKVTGIYLNQQIATLGGFMCMFLVAIEQGWLLHTSEYYKKDKLNKFEDRLSWSNNFVSFGSRISGAFLAAIWLYKFGSRSTILLAVSYRVFQWSYRLYDPHPLMNNYIVVRLIGGTATAVTLCSLFIFLGEVLLPKMRGTLISICCFGFPIGMIIDSSIFSYVRLESWTVIYCILSWITFILFTRLNDTPYFLANNLDFDKAKRSIIAYFPGHDVEEKMNEIKTFTEDISIEQGLNQKSIFKRFKNILQELKKPVSRQSLLLVFVLSAFPRIVNGSPIALYKSAIFQQHKINFISLEALTISMIITGLVGFVLLVNQVDKSGRKLVFIFSSVGQCTSDFGLGIYSYFQNETFENKYLQAIPLLFIHIQTVSYLIGYMSAANIAVSELPPNNIKILAAFILPISLSASYQLSSEMYRILVVNLGLTLSFFVQAAISLLAIPIAVYLIPETKQKSLLEIQNDYNSLRRRKCYNLDV